MIPRDEIDKVIAEVKLEDIVGANHTLKSAGGGKLKCKCPFHEENSASFIIFTDNRYKCFGCGKSGNVINYLMERDQIEFADAVRTLAKQQGIELHETASLSAEEIEAEKKRELMRITYEKVQAFFVSNLHESNIEASTALEYATNRWNAAFVEEYGIGYAYDSYSKLKEFAKKENLSFEILKEMGLLKYSEKNHSEYDAFRCRLMIPIRSISHMVIGYTARHIEKAYALSKHTMEEEPSKYINSTNNLLFCKSKTVFGIDRAYFEGAKENLFYLVEGGPDVLRLQSIGIQNVVASLGGNWTENQLAILQKRAMRLCIIPDSDKVPAGKPWGIGIDKAIATAELALQKGFTEVHIKEIPQPNPDKKIDADEYFTDSKAFSQIKSMEFIEWYATKLSVVSPEAQLQNITTIARLMSYIEDECAMSLLLPKVSKLIKASKAAWREAINKERRTRTQSDIQNKEGRVYDAETIDKFGFQQEENHYISFDGRGYPVLWSNFMLKPLFHIKGSFRSSRIFKMVNDDDQTEIVELKTRDLVGVNSFREKVESLGNFVWLGKGDSLLRLKQFLFKTTETATEIEQLGWQRRFEFYAFGNGIFYNCKWHPADEYGIVRLDKGKETQKNYYLPASSKLHMANDGRFQFERLFVHKSQGNFTMADYVGTFVAAYHDNAKVAFAYLIAALFRDIIFQETKMFPILNVFGPKGTGKSEFGHAIMEFFMIENTAPNIQTSTGAALAETVAQCCNAIVHIDEYKNTIDADKIEFLKGLWDGIGRNRMNMDKDKKREITHVEAAILLSGQEMPTEDPALFSRLIFLTNNTTAAQRTQEERDSYNKLKAMRQQGCTHLTLELLKYRSQFGANFKSSWNVVVGDLLSALADSPIDERILNNWVVPLSAFHALRNTIKDVLKLNFDYEDLKSCSVALMLRQQELVKSNSEVASFWDVLSSLSNKNIIHFGVDYLIETRDSVRIKDEINKNESHLVDFSGQKTLLFLRFKFIFQQYAILCKASNQKYLPKTSLAFYLKTLPKMYLGKTTTMRFPEAKEGEDTDQAMCFDYTMIQDEFGLNMKSHTISKGGETSESG